MKSMYSYCYGVGMAMLTVRNLPDDVHRALRVQAAQNGRSTEAEVREILSNAVLPESRLKLGDALASLGREIGFSHSELDALNQLRNRTPAEPVRFE